MVDDRPGMSGRRVVQPRGRVRCARLHVKPSAPSVAGRSRRFPAPASPPRAGRRRRPCLFRWDAPRTRPIPESAVRRSARSPTCRRRDRRSPTLWVNVSTYVAPAAAACLLSIAFRSCSADRDDFGGSVERAHLCGLIGELGARGDVFRGRARAADVVQRQRQTRSPSGGGTRAPTAGSRAAPPKPAARRAGALVSAASTDSRRGIVPMAPPAAPDSVEALGRPRHQEPPP